MDADSEDVICENSPLYEYLNEAGYSDFECYAKKTASINSSEIKTSNSWNLYIIFRRLFSALKTSGKRCYDAVCAFVLQDFQDLGCSTRKEIITFISNTKLLIEDDKTFLRSFASEFIEKYEYCALSSFSKWKCKAKTIGSPYILAGGIALFSWYVSSNSQLLRKSNIWNIFDKILLAFAVTVIIGHSTRNIVYYYYKKNARRSIDRLKELIEISINIGCLAKKCIRFIQEAEIVARGFTLASLKVPAQRLELSGVTSSPSKRQCPELRENIFHWTRNTYYRYRQATLEIYKIIPLQPTLDVLSHYLAAITVEEFGPIIKLSANSESEKQNLMEASDQFSLSSLKSVFQLMEIQRSEFFRLFTMGFIPDSLMEIKQDSISALGILSRLIPYIDQLIEADLKTHSFLIATHNYYKSLEVYQLLGEGEEQLHATKSSPNAALSLAVHSLNLHLRAALKRVQSAEQQLERLKENKDCSMTDFQVNFELASCLKEVGAELDASKECLNETELELNLLVNVPGENSETSPPSESHLIEQSSRPVVSLIEIAEPIIEDQVFEAFTDRVETEINVAPSTASNIQQKLKEQKEREASSHLLRELKSVLVTKALEHKLREEKALAMVKSVVETSQKEQDSLTVPEIESQKDDSPMQEETSSDDSPQDNLTDKSIETLRESDEIERWELLSDKEVEPSYNNNESHLYRSSERIETITTDSENNVTEISPNSNIRPILDDVSFALGSSIAAIAAERCRNLGMHMETFSAEAEECFGDDDDDDDDSS